VSATSPPALDRPADAGRYDVYAVVYGRRRARRGEHFLDYDERAAEPHETAYSFWLLLGRDATVLVDTGMAEARAGRFPGLEYDGTADGLLARLGVAQGEVDHVVLTHLHYDHAGGVAAFPDAVLVLQRAELDYWSGPTARRVTAQRWLVDEADQTAVRGAGERGRLRLVDGDAEILPGVTVHLVGGHTPGTQVVRVQGRQGVVLIASDAAHFAENLERDAPSRIFLSLPDVYLGFDRIHELAPPPAVVVPGHDPLVVLEGQRVRDSPVVVRLSPSGAGSERTGGRSA
jgi:glyoxylase-like metal-dependent hydrolase (beta-lactamase superfamily II)